MISLSMTIECAFVLICKAQNLWPRLTVLYFSLWPENGNISRRCAQSLKIPWKGYFMEPSLENPEGMGGGGLWDNSF